MSGAGVNIVVVMLVAAAVAATVAVALGFAKNRHTRNPDTPVSRVTAFPRSGSGRWSLGLAVVYVLALQGVLGLGFADPLDTKSAADWTSKVILLAIVMASLVLGASSRRSERAVLVLAGMIVITWVGLVPIIGSFFFE
jgi:hypothetical protein